MLISIDCIRLNTTICTSNRYSGYVSFSKEELGGWAQSWVLSLFQQGPLLQWYVIGKRKEIRTWKFIWLNRWTAKVQHRWVWYICDRLLNTLDRGRHGKNIGGGQIVILVSYNWSLGALPKLLRVYSPAPTPLLHLHDTYDTMHNAV